MRRWDVLAKFDKSTHADLIEVLNYYEECFYEISRCLTTGRIRDASQVYQAAVQARKLAKKYWQDVSYSQNKIREMDEEYDRMHLHKVLLSGTEDTQKLTNKE